MITSVFNVFLNYISGILNYFFCNYNLIEHHHKLLGYSCINVCDRSGNNVYSIETFPEDVESIVIEYNGRRYSNTDTANKIRRVNDMLIPMSSSLLPFFYFHTNALKSDIVLTITDCDDKTMCGTIKKSDNRELKGWYKETQRIMEY